MIAILIPKKLYSLSWYRDSEPKLMLGCGVHVGAVGTVLFEMNEDKSSMFLKSLSAIFCSGIPF